MRSSYTTMICAAGLLLVATGDALKAAPGQADNPIASQSSVSSKKPFGVIPQSADAVKKAGDPKNLQKAQAAEGKTATFYGIVTDVYISHGNAVVLLDFAPNYRSAITGVVKPADYTKFPDLNLLNGKSVLITGKVIAYDGRPEVILDNYKNIKVVTP